jgi:cyclohexanone monooxygenase
VVAEKLIPNYPPLSRRTAGETGYFRAFNRDNVELVDVAEDPIDRITPAGVRLASSIEHELDVLICATGFDAGGGSALHIEITGRDGVTLRDHWQDGVRTFLGLMVHGFPNLYLMNGPQSPGPFFNPPMLVKWELSYLDDVWRSAEAAGASRVEPTAEAEDRWTDDVNGRFEGTMIAKVDSWWMGTNIPGKPRRGVGYRGGMPNYVAAARAGLTDGAYVFEAGAELALDRDARA